MLSYLRVCSARYRNSRKCLVELFRDVLEAEAVFKGQVKLVVPVQPLVAFLCPGTVQATAGTVYIYRHVLLQMSHQPMIVQEMFK